ncbi:hypothetical protein BS17DRAFT_279984 [Gyrodon lividus]|nr:hypothetical protein BS17DRAFT_279984 [Gyrodon lividus]
MLALVPYSVQERPQSNWQCIHSSHHQLPFARQDCSSFLAPNACPQCQVYPKHPEHRFCSLACTHQAARSAPGLIHLPQHHELFDKVATKFLMHWKSVPHPRLLAIFMITWTKKYQMNFEKYRNEVEARCRFKQKGFFSGNEQKRFRCAARACTLGERGNLYPCDSEICELCETICCGFEPYLDRKRNIPRTGNGIRLGAGIYTSHTSSKADQYAVNRHDPSSTVKAMLVCRVVIGKPYETRREDPMLTRPPAGYDCVFAKPGWWSEFKDDEIFIPSQHGVFYSRIIIW